MFSIRVSNIASQESLNSHLGSEFPEFTNILEWDFDRRVERTTEGSSMANVFLGGRLPIRGCFKV